MYVGSADGLNVDSTVGDRVRLYEGSPVGTSVASGVGSRVGSYVGFSVGFKLGPIVGRQEGNLVGLTVGILEGARLGLLVALAAVGDLVGEEEQNNLHTNASQVAWGLQHWVLLEQPY